MIRRIFPTYKSLSPSKKRDWAKVDRENKKRAAKLAAAGHHVATACAEAGGHLVELKFDRAAWDRQCEEDRLAAEKAARLRRRGVQPGRRVLGSVRVAADRCRRKDRTLHLPHLQA